MKARTRRAGRRWAVQVPSRTKLRAPKWEPFSSEPECKWYHFGMAMTLRLPNDLDQQLEVIARERSMSKHAVLVEAAMRLVATETKTSQVVRLADDVMSQYAETITRLEDA